MADTIIEKIIAAHSGVESVAPGDIVWMSIDCRTARDFGGPNAVKRFNEQYPGEKVDDPRRTFFTFDCYVQTSSSVFADNQQACRVFAKEQGIRVFDVNSGIGSHVLIEHGLVYPGVTCVGTDSHLNVLGSICALGQGMGDADIAYAFRHGRTWFEVPGTIKIHLKGKPPPPVSGKDITLKVLREIGTSGALGKAVEFEGDIIEVMDIPSRVTLASMATEMGAITALIPPNDDVIEMCRVNSGMDDIPRMTADEGASYEREIEIDLSRLKLQIACPPSPSNVVDVADIAGRKVDSVFIGSCTNGRFEDFEAAAKVLRGNRLADGVTMRLQPSTREEYGKLISTGLINIFHDAGAIVINAGCGNCAQGQSGMIGKDEVHLSTTNRNFPGKQGFGEMYLCSPYVAARAAVAGEITE